MENHKGYILFPKYHKFQQERTVGEYTYLLPDPPNKNKIDGYKLPKHKQRWERPIIPIDLEYQPESDQLPIIEREWDRRKNGFWFYNNGILEYITGHHYFLLAHFYADGKYFKWTDAHRDIFYWWDLVEKDPMCIGGILNSYRRIGKSFLAGSTELDIATSTPYAQCGIQSKDDPSAKELFKKVVNGWRKLPYFFKPIDSGVSSPKDRIEFEEPSSRNTKEQKKVYGTVLNSVIDFRASTETAYDGNPQKFHISDEIGKLNKGDAYNRLKIVEKCLYEEGQIVGKIFATSTVGEMERGGGANFLKMWNEADPTKALNKYGQTVNKMKRFFVPAYYGYMLRNPQTGLYTMDEYGYSMQEDAIDYHLETRKPLKGETLAAERRANPLDLKDAFQTINNGNDFDQVKIQEQFDWNDIHVNTVDGVKVMKGNFIEDSMNPQIVNWWPDEENGRFSVIWLPEPKDRNKVEVINGKLLPKNYYEGVIGVDPVGKRFLTGKGSDFAAVGFRRISQKFDHDERLLGTDPISNMPVFIYRCRLPNTDIHHKDMECAARFYGWPIHAEDNRAEGLITHFTHTDYYHYLMSRQAATGKYDWLALVKGTPNYQKEVREAWVNYVKSYIYENVGVNEETGGIGKIYFNALLEDFRDFDPDDWGPYDLFVAFVYCLSAIRTITQPKKKNDVPLIEMPRYDNTGDRSKAIRY